MRASTCRQNVLSFLGKTQRCDDLTGYTYIVRVFHFLFRSRITATAALAVVVLLGALLFQLRLLVSDIVQPAVAEVDTVSGAAIPATDASWQQELVLLGLATTSETSNASGEDPIAMIGPIVVAQLVGQYAGLVESGTYSEAAGDAVAESIARNVKAVISYKTYTSADVRTDTDISYNRMLEYRSDLRDALAPLLENTESELDIFARYVETSDEAHLKTLAEAAANYDKALTNAAAVVAPRDAINYHLDVLNALSLFDATLDAMAGNTLDEFATVALLRSYNTAEQKMFYAFDALGNYYGQKTP